ncbi:TolC family protein [Sorangium sp. So ce1182]|uniref:TolC family protein n=1 Tax=Sorangium sp. So ce1182 TaxID=3133334 RepID=UPI003F5EB1C7
MTIGRPHRSRRAMFAALAAALVLMPASSARGETLTWAQVKARAAARSPAAVEAKQGARAARAEAAGAGRWPRTNPVLTGGVDLGAPFGRPEDRTLSVGIEQELDVFGVAAAAARAGQQKVAVAELEGAVLKLDGLAETADAFIELERAQRALAVWTELDRVFERIAAGTTAASRAGERSDLDAILASAESAGATTELAGAKAALARAQARLGVLIAARDPSSLRVAEEPVRPPDARGRDALVAVALRRRPEVALFRARLGEAAARRTLAARAALPEPTVGLGVETEREGREASPVSPDGASGARHGRTQLQITLAVPLPFFDRKQAERARALADASSAGEQGAIAARQISAAVTRAKSAVDASWAALARWQAIAPRLDEAQAMVERGHAAGQVDLFDTLASAERVARARVQSLEARAAYLKARAELSRAVGEEP